MMQLLDIDASIPPPSVVPLTATKVLAPSIRPKRVVRQRLLAQLDQVLAHRMLLVSAPAGSGKTSVVAEWVQQLAIPVAWVSLDATDNDPAHFWAYVSRALEASFRKQPQAAQQFAPIAASFPTLIINAFTHAPNPIVLVLDDYQRITNPNIHEALDWLLERMPQHLHLLLITRSDPPFALARMHARGELAELRMHDLAFNQDEAESFVHDVMELTLNPSIVTQWWHYSEGWIAGLQLAALAARGIGTPLPAPAPMMGNQRLVADYLGDEVVRGLPAEVQSFVRVTAHLDRFCAALCDAVLAQPAAAPSQRMLATLERANLFLVPLDNQRQWYRYHHLFADVLRNQADQHPSAVQQIHQRAAHWFADAGLTHEAIAHALAANDRNYALHLLAPIAMRMVWQGEAHTLLTWLGNLPIHEIAVHPEIQHAQAWALVATRQSAALDQLLDHAEQLQASNSVPPTSVFDIREIARLRAAVANMLGNPRMAIALVQKILPHLRTEDYDYRVIFANELGMAQRMLGDSASAELAFSEAVAVAHASGNPTRIIISLSHLGMLQSWRGALQQAATTFRAALQIAIDTGTPDLPATGLAQIGLGRVLYEWGDLRGAETHIRRGLDRGMPWWSRDIQMAGIPPLARVFACHNDLDSLNCLYDDAKLLALQFNLAWPAATVAAILIQLHLTRGDIAEAQTLAATVGLGHWRGSDGFGRVGELQVVTNIRLLIAQRAYQQALEAIDDALSQVVGGGSHSFVIECQLLATLLHVQLGDAHTARDTLESAILLAEPDQHMQVFLTELPHIHELLLNLRRQSRSDPAIQRFIQRLIDMAQADSSGTQASMVSTTASAMLIEPLRDRELQILALLAAGRSTQEIADMLILSVGTVKWYLHNLYAKLQVRSRTQAVARARALRVLE